MARNQEKPNVVVFLTDQQRWDTAGVHGNPLHLTPNFDWMAERGTHVDQSITCQPVCGPARSSLQTGMYATRAGVFHNGLLPDAKYPALAHYFNEHGYATGYIGKWHLADQDPVPHEQRGGYDYWLGANLLEFTSLPYETVLYDNGNNAVRLPGYRVDALTDAAIRYIGDHASEPFYLFLSHLEPHHQNQHDNYPAPDRYAEWYRDAWTPADLRALGGTSAQHLPGYYGMVKRLDEALGRLLDALKSLGLLENTIVLFTSDHGCHFKTRNSEYKRSCHESSVRVPTALMGPGFDGGGKIERVVSLIDLPPTLLDAAGIAVPDHMQGRSLVPLLGGDSRRSGATGSEDRDDAAYIEISESQVARAIRTQRWKYCVSAPDKDPFADSHSEVYVEEALYDLHADPYELTNLVTFDSHREVARALRERLVRQIVQAGDPEPEIREAQAGQELRHKPMPDWGRIQRQVFPGDESQ